MILPPGNLLGQLQRLQQEAARLRSEIAQKTVTIDVGAGMVRVTMGGRSAGASYPHCPTSTSGAGGP